jgi:pyruvate formate lyase activating enzyme
MGLESQVGFINDIQLYSLSDGPGIRSTVFLKGCLLNCRWCHNPEGSRRYPQVFPYQTNCNGCGDCLEACPAGAIEMAEPCQPRILRERCIDCFQCTEVCREDAMVVWGRMVSVDEVMEEVQADQPFYKHSGGGMTVSGGEPLAQPEFVRALMAAAKERGISTALDTCGYAAWEIVERVLEVTDHVLLDIKHMDPQAHRAYCGAPNGLILENAAKIAALVIPLRFRVPLIPGFNDSEDNLARTAEFIGALCGNGRECAVDILPYHPYADAKYRIFGLDYPFPAGEVYDEEKLAGIVDIFVSRDLAVTVGG